MQPKDVVEQFIADTRAHRFDKAKAWLVADGFVCVGPNMYFLRAGVMWYLQFGIASSLKVVVLCRLRAVGETV